MPEVTPIYGFPYPCASEPVDFADFAALANAIDTKYAELLTDTDIALNRYNSVQNVTTQAGIAVGVDTVMTNPNATYVIPAAGVYLVFATYTMVTATTITSARFRVRLNGVQVFGRTFNFEFGNITTFVHLPPVPLICATGDTISFTFLYQGTGTASVSFNYVPRMIVRIA